MISGKELLTEADKRRIDALLPLIERDIYLLKQDGLISQFDFPLEGGHRCLDGAYLNQAEFDALRGRYGGAWLIQQKHDGDAAPVLIEV